MKRQCLALGAVIALLALALLASALPALSAGDIVVTASRHENRYPTEAKFYLEARSSSDITKVTFTYDFVGGKTSAYAYPEFTPAKEIKIEYRWDTRLKYVAPGTEIAYYWQIDDAAGNTLKTEPTRFTFDDTRFTWRSLTEDQITLLWYRGDEKFGRELLDEGVRAARQLNREAGVESKSPIRVLIYATQRDMMGVLEQGAKEWTGGRSFSSMGVVVIAAGADTGGRAFALRAVPHELSHVIIHRATDNPYSSLPTWLDEGLAMYAEGPLEGPYEGVLRRAVRDNKLISLRTLSSSFPADADQAHLSYAQSYSVVKFIIDKYGREGMGKLLEIFSKGSTQERALQQALGVNLAGLEAEWRASLGAAAPATAAPKPTTSPQPLVAAGTATPGPSAPRATPAPTPKPQPFGGLPCALPAVGLALAGVGAAWWGARRRASPTA